jgi:hypothetical protein
MGKNCGPLFSDFLSYSYGAELIKKLRTACAEYDLHLSLALIQHLDLSTINVLSITNEQFHLHDDSISSGEFKIII